MATLTVPMTIIQKKRKKKFHVEIDRHSFERLVDSLGLFRPAFLDSLEQAEADVRARRTTKLRSLRDLNKRA